jgi:hypothetical protein
MLFPHCEIVLTNAKPASPKIKKRFWNKRAVDITLFAYLIR